MSFSEEQLTRLRGQLRIKNISKSIVQLTSYNNYIIEVDEEIDILDPTIPNTLRAIDYSTAKNMVGRASVDVSPTYVTYEIAQKISFGLLVVSKDIRPDLSVIEE